MSQDKKICDRLGHEVGRICNNQELDFSCYMFLRLWVHLLLLHKLATLIESVSFSLYFDFLRQHFDHRASYIFPPNFNLKHLRKFSSGLQNIKTNQFFILKISWKVRCMNVHGQTKVLWKRRWQSFGVFPLHFFQIVGSISWLHELIKISLI